MSKTTRSHIECLFMDKWTIPYGIPTHMLMDNGKPFVTMLFKKLCTFRGMKYLTTRAYHPPKMDRKKDLI